MQRTETRQRASVPKIISSSRVASKRMLTKQGFNVKSQQTIPDSNAVSVNWQFRYKDNSLERFTNSVRSNAFLDTEPGGHDQINFGKMLDRGTMGQQHLQRQRGENSQYFVYPYFRTRSN